MKRNILAIETSSPLLSVALQKAAGPVIETTSGDAMTHAERLLPVIIRLLKRKKMTLEDIDTFVIGYGPGSYTGLRIGFATLKGFLAVEKKECFGVISPDSIAQGVALPEGSRLGVCLDARREKMFIRLYNRCDSRWVPEGDLRVTDPDKIAGELRDGMSLTGDALRRYRGLIEKKLREKRIDFLPESLWYPKASSMIELFNRNTSVKRLVKAEDFVPFYLRLPEPEEKLKSHAAHH